MRVSMLLAVMLLCGCAVQRTVLKERMPNAVLVPEIGPAEPQNKSVVNDVVAILRAPLDIVTAIACAISDITAGVVDINLGTSGRKSVTWTVVVGSNACDKLPLPVTTSNVGPEANKGTQSITYGDK